MNKKTPITYYGGKQKLLSTILTKIPDHKLYCEPFVGGAAVFFGKPISEVEAINAEEILEGTWLVHVEPRNRRKCEQQRRNG